MYLAILGCSTRIPPNKVIKKNVPTCKALLAMKIQLILYGIQVRKHGLKTCMFVLLSQNLDISEENMIRLLWWPCWMKKLPTAYVYKNGIACYLWMRFWPLTIFSYIIGAHQTRKPNATQEFHAICIDTQLLSWPHNCFL